MHRKRQWNVYAVSLSLFLYIRWSSIWTINRVMHTCIDSKRENNEKQSSEKRNAHTHIKYTTNKAHHVEINHKNRRIYKRIYVTIFHRLSGAAAAIILLLMFCVYFLFGLCIIIISLYSILFATLNLFRWSQMVALHCVYAYPIHKHTQTCYLNASDQFVSFRICVCCILMVLSWICFSLSLTHSVFLLWLECALSCFAFGSTVHAYAKTPPNKSEYKWGGVCLLCVRAYTPYIVQYTNNWTTTNCSSWTTRHANVTINPFLRLHGVLWCLCLGNNDDAFFSFFLSTTIRLFMNLFSSLSYAFHKFSSVHCIVQMNIYLYM